MAVKRVTYFSVEVEDKPGVLADFCAALRDHKVNLKGLWGFGTVSFAKTRFICVFNNFACLSPNQNFRDQNLILA